MVSTVMDVLNYWNITPLIRPVVKRVIDVLFSNQLRDVDDIADMPSPRVIKSHLPFHMLNPQLLDTSKVHILLVLYLFESCKLKLKLIR